MSRGSGRAGAGVWAGAMVGGGVVSGVETL